MPAQKSPSKKSAAATVKLVNGQVQAGFATWAEEDPSATLDLNIDNYLIEHREATFLVRVSGDSMIEAGIFPHDILVVDRSLAARHNNIVIAVVDGDLTVKRLFQKSNGRAELRAENRHFPSLQFEKATEIIIWGVVTGVIRKLD